MGISNKDLRDYFGLHLDSSEEGTANEHECWGHPCPGERAGGTAGQPGQGGGGMQPGLPMLGRQMTQVKRVRQSRHGSAEARQRLQQQMDDANKVTVPGGSR